MSEAGSEVSVAGLSKRYGATRVLHAIDFRAEAGSFVTLLGPSGCGKTTTLRLIAGFEDADAGEVLLGGQSLNKVPPWKRGLGVVFQSYALFPFMTVRENVAFGLRRQGMKEADIRRKVGAALELVALPGFEARFPRQLSGGQQQRVALARALVIEPAVLLLDEPLSNLDAKLRAEMRFELKRIQRDAGVTTILVTHDQDEALTLSDHIVVMNRGRVVTQGAPRQVWDDPGARFVAEFLGVENLYEGALTGDGGFRVAGGTHVVRLHGEPAAARTGGALSLGFRAADVSLSRQPPAPGEGAAIAGVVEEAVYRGSFFTCRVATELGPRPVVAECAFGLEPVRGEKLWVQLPAQRHMLLRDDAADAADASN